MAMLNFYVPGDGKVIRQQLNQIAAGLGFVAKSGPAGSGGSAAMLVAIAHEEVRVMTRSMTMAEADALALGKDPDTLTGEELLALNTEQQAKRETALLADPHAEDTAVRFWRSHRDPFEAIDESRQHVIIDNDKPGFFIVSGNCPDAEFSTFVEDVMVMGRRIGPNTFGNTVYERLAADGIV